MISSLAAQLAAQATNSVASLDLHLQKSAHSTSLIWEPKDATSQTFRKIYSICFDAFSELCTLEPRLSRFASTLFDEASQHLDRTTKTAAENEGLDREIQAFLRLSGKWLNLQITVRAVEWLVRRFRVLEMNTEFLITTFLPWHSLPVFNNLLDILPKKLPPVYHFLSPYAASHTSIPRERFVDQAIQNRDFVTILSRYTIGSCQAHQGHHVLVVFWGTVISQALGARIERGRSGRQGKQIENDQTLFALFAPIVGEAMVVKKDPSLQIASYMALSIYATKGNLDDGALAAFMEQLVVGWSNDTVEPGIYCLAILAQQRSPKQLSRKVTKALLKVPHLPQILAQIGQKLNVDRLANGICLALVERLAKRGDASAIPIIDDLLRANILKEQQVSVIFKSLIVAAHQLDDTTDESGEARNSLGLSLTSLSQAPDELGEIIQKTLTNVDFDMEQLELKLNTSLRRNQDHLLIAAEIKIKAEPGEMKGISSKGRLEAALAALQASKAHPKSCLSPSSNSVFDDLCETFLLLNATEESLDRFDGLPLLRQDASIKDPFYISFFMRVWCGPFPVLARVAALEKVKSWLKTHQDASVDFQASIPYVIAALSDPSKKVRRTAAGLLTVLGTFYEGKRKPESVWGSPNLYDEDLEIKSFGPDACGKFLPRILSALEECILSAEYIHTVLKTSLESSKSSEGKDKKGMSQSTRLATLDFLSGHVVKSPLLTLKSRLLEALNQVRGVSSTSRTRFLLPVLQWWASLSPEEATKLADDEKLDESSLNSSFVAVVSPSDKPGLDALFDILKSKSSGNREVLVRAVFSHTEKIWPTMKGETQVYVAQTMLELCFGEYLVTDLVIGEAMQLLRNVELSSQILGIFLEDLGSLPKIPAQASPSKKRRRSSSSSTAHPSETVDRTVHDMVSKTTFVLELVEGSDPAKHPELLDILFGTLSELHQYKIHIGSELGYLQNLVLKSLLAIIPVYEEDKNLKIQGSHGHGDVLIHCVQKSSSPSVQNSALLLIAALATTAPELILHSIMPVFAFMGTSVLRQGDDYSAHVINQTITSVVPPLIHSLRRQKRNTVLGTTELLANFVTAYEHIPSHRKASLFHSLIETLGPNEFTFAIVGMLVDRYGATDEVISFAVEIMSSYSVETQLHTVSQLLDLVTDVFKPKPTLSAALFPTEENQERRPFEIAASQMSLVPRLLAGKKLRSEVGAVVEKDDMEASKIRELYAAILANILLMADTVKGNKFLHDRCGDSLANLLNLLSIGEFIKAVENLLDRPNVVLRQRVLRALEIRVDSENRTDAKSRVVLLAFLPTLTAVIRDSNDIHYKHTAVACVDKISEKYGKKDIEAVTAAAATIAGDHCLGETDERLRNMALLCLASLVDVLQDNVIAILPTAIPKTIEYIGHSLEGDSPNSTLHNAGYHFITSLAQHLPFMMTGKYLDKVLAISLASAGKDLDEECDDARRECLELLAHQVDAKGIFTSLERIWEIAAASELIAIREYLQVLGMALDKHPKTAVSKNLFSLSTVFTGALDLRRTKHAGGDWDDVVSSQIDALEDLVNEVALKMIYKLNDTTFRPIFSQLIDWSLSLPNTDKVGQVARLQSLYGFLHAFFDNIKSAATNYATYIVDNAIQILTTADLNDKMLVDLWKRVLVTVTKCFEHDGSDFWQAPAHFNAISPALTSQLSKAASIDLKPELIPAIVELAAAADSQDHHKELNTAILQHLKPKTAPISLAVVLCQQALVDRHGDEWLQALPEMLPCISELQDHGDDVVERETHRWITKIETVLGENLDAMLQ
ncbi:ssu processome component [Zalerion maritima]|uniref:U3 small nucleolar RNA-associated protein 10 n=1 Tax=Zalerion maritima TaxID=339359 RepID=A0AAD5WTC3_9PEZI|nr:ssu processome component [Zalerion maritima]